MKIFFLLLLMVSSLYAGPFSVPTPPKLEEQIQESDYIVHADIENVNQTKIQQDVFSVQCSLKIKRAYKAKEPLSPDLDVSFIIKPRTYGKMLVEAPPKGEYIIFLQNKTVKDANGRSSNTIVLYDPNPFSIQPFSAKLEKQILKLVD